MLFRSGDVVAAATAATWGKGRQDPEGKTATGKTPRPDPAAVGPIPPQAELALVTFELNGVSHGEILVALRGDDVLIDAAALEAAGIPLGDAAREELDDRWFVLLSSLAAQESAGQGQMISIVTAADQGGLRGQLDTRELVMRLEIGRASGRERGEIWRVGGS